MSEEGMKEVLPKDPAQTMRMVSGTVGIVVGFYLIGSGIHGLLTNNKGKRFPFGSNSTAASRATQETP
jgi:hypothetical protein